MTIDLGSRTTTFGSPSEQRTMATAIAVNRITGEVIAYGDEAESLRERTPDGVSVVYPVQHSAVADLDLAGRFLELVWNELGRLSPLRRGRLRVLTPAQLNRLEQNVLAEAVSVCGSSPEFVPNCLACAASHGYDAGKAQAFACVNLGAETTETAVFTQGNLLRGDLLKLGADELTLAIQRGASNEFGVDISWWTAEELKRTLGDITPGLADESTMTVTARDRVSGLPTELAFASHNIRIWMEPYLQKLRVFLRTSLANLPPRAAGDICQRGLLLSGGGSLQPGMAAFVEATIGVRAEVAEHPVAAGVIGAEKIA